MTKTEAWILWTVGALFALRLVWIAVKRWNTPDDPDDHQWPY